MDGIRKIAKAYYERANEAEKNEAKEFFRILDLNGDGKLDLTEFRLLSDYDEMFNKLDPNGDGALYFWDVLVFFYISKGAISIHHCDGCREPLLDPYLTCSQCVPKWPDTCNLCCACYSGGKFKHQHPSSDLLHVEAAHDKSIQHKQTQSDMEQLGEIARAHYRAGSSKVQDLAKEFFNSMDADGDGKVDFAEFLSFMKQQGFWQMRNPNFFKELDTDGNGALDFWEVMTLYYIIKSGRPFCDMCGEFIPGIFFSCVECFKGNPESSFDLCLRCYQSDDCKHNHNGRTQFLDNYTLLQAKRDSALGQATGVTTFYELAMKAQATSSATSKAIVPVSRKSKMDVAFKALEVGLAIGNISNTLCTIL